MHLTLHTDYALRLLMYLGLQADRRSTIEEVARHYGISRNHLMKVGADVRMIRQARLAIASADAFTGTGSSRPRRAS